MASKDITTPSIVSLTEKAAQRLAKILREPSTTKQKTSVQKAVGVYSFYQKKWHKKAQ